MNSRGKQIALLPLSFRPDYIIIPFHLRGCYSIAIGTILRLFLIRFSARNAQRLGPSPRVRFA